MTRIGPVVVIGLLVALLAATSAIAADDVLTPDRAYVDAALDSLVETGVLTAEQVSAIKARGTRAAAAVADEIAAREAEKPKPKKQWYDTTKISGYAQGRFLYYPDEDGEPDNEFMVRRARIKVEGKPADGVKVQVQADFGEGEASVKDAWVQKAWGEDHQNFVRVGQQKIPFGFETPQSSSRRLPLERNWVARRTISGERDTGVTYFYTTPESRDLFDLAKDDYYGTGDYGNVAIGLYNGQGPGTGEVNNNKHFVIRGSYPMLISLKGDEENKDQYLEVGASYFAGDYFSTGADMEFDEDLLGIHAYLAPQPIGVQAEFYTGETEGHDIDGFYVMGIYEVPNCDGTFFVRYDDMDGYRKGRGSDYSRDRWSIGYAHMIDSKTRVTVEYDKEDIAGGGSNDLFGIQVMTKY